MRAKRAKNGESGFALLLVFLMAAVIAITMYMEIPRVAFASQRQKEQLLMERGEQYKIAIQRFCQANANRWPAKIEDLENFNNRRFLRHRYIDPMTGKDEWRLIHIQNGVLTDSVNTKPQDKKDDKKGASEGYLAETAGLGTLPLPGQGAAGANAALRRRPSDGGNTGTDPSGQPVIPGQNQLLPTGASGAPGTTVPSTGGTPPTGVTGINAGNLPPGLPVPPGLNNNNGTPPNPTGGLVGTNGLGGQPSNPTGQQGIYAGQTQLPGMPGNPANSQTGGVSPYQTSAGANGVPPGFPQPGTNVGAQPGQANPAVGMINQILTSPRPGGLAGIQAANSGQPTTIGGGIAGFASTLDADSIMVYNDHSNYSQWEFVFDPTKFRKPAPPNGGLVGTAVSQMGTMPTGGPGGTPVASMSSGPNIGSAPTAGPGGGFGQPTPTGQQPGQQQQGQSGLSNAFGGGLPNIRPGRR